MDQTFSVSAGDIIYSVKSVHEYKFKQVIRNIVISKLRKISVLVMQ